MKAAPRLRRTKRADEAPGDSDAELVRACLLKDERAWSRLLARHAGLIRSVALRQGLRRDQAEDVFQSVAATLAERLVLIEDPDCLPKWLMVTAARRARLFAARDRRAALPLELPPPVPSEGVEGRLVRQETRRLVRAALAELAPRDREVLADLFERELPYAEVARRHGLAIGSLGSLRARALARLRRILAREGVR